MNVNNLIQKLILTTVLLFFLIPLKSQNLKENTALDEKVRKFLNSSRWYDMNIPDVDGKLLYDIIIKNNYKSALEIGTSTGHSGIWIAWALSKTDGKLVTIEIDELICLYRLSPFIKIINFE